MATAKTKNTERRHDVTRTLTPAAPTTDKPFLHKADDLIKGNRQKDYGDKLPNFTQIAMLWQGTLATKLAPDVKITAEDVALCMMQVKIARLAKSPEHADSILDVAGYAGCYDALQKERQNAENEFMVPALKAYDDAAP